MNKKRNILLGIGFLSLAIFVIIVMVMMYVKNEHRDDMSEKNMATSIVTKNIEPVLLPQEQTIDVNGSTDSLVPNEAMLHDGISLPLNVFKNPDTTLQLGEHIDILGMFEFGKEKQQFSTRYIALHVSVIGFMKDGKKVNAIASVQVDEKTQVSTKVFADDILLDMSPRDIGNFLSLYYKSQELNNDHAHNPNNLYQGHMWMVKCNPVVSVGEEAIKRKMMNGHAVAHPKASVSFHPSMAALPKLILAPAKGIVSYEQ